jgi:large subunit ribosomal protein L13
VGRLATKIADILRGKNKPTFRPYINCGDKVSVSNASKMVLTGNKINQKMYYHHTGYLGHLKTVSAKELMIKNPSIILIKAVTGMLPKNKLQDKWLKNLKVTN